MVALSVADRKERMPHGGQKKVAEEVGVFPSYVSAVMAGEVRPKTKRTLKKLRRVQRRCAREIGLPFEVVFPEAVPDLMARAS